jgi:hypothetical protein
LRYAAVAVVDGRLIIAGGSEGSEASRAILSFDPQSGTVTSIGELPTPLTHATAATLGGIAYVIGGRGASISSQTSAIVAIDPATGRATPAGHLSEPLSDTGAVATGGRILVAGGRSAAGPQATISELRLAGGR